MLPSRHDQGHEPSVAAAERREYRSHGPYCNRTAGHSALANEREQTNAAAQVVLKLKTAWRDGTTYLVMSPLEFMRSRDPSPGASADSKKTNAVYRPKVRRLLTCQVSGLHTGHARRRRRRP
jgi:hypothetical protein